MALRQEVTAQAVGDLAGINPVILLLGRGDGTKHQRMCDLDLFSVWQKMIVNPARENCRLHGNHPGLRKRSYPGVQFQSARSDLALSMDLTAGIFDAITNPLLVNIQPNVIHMSVRSLRGCSLNQRSR